MGDVEKSEKLRVEIAEEDNDSKALGLHSKLIREERNEVWELKWLPRFKSLLDDRMWFIEDQNMYRIQEDAAQLFDFYPKANKVFEHRTKKWHKPGLKFLIKHFKMIDKR